MRIYTKNLTLSYSIKILRANFFFALARIVKIG